MKISSGENRNGKIVLHLEMDDKPNSEISLNSMDAMEIQSLIGALLQEAVNDPSAKNYIHAGIHHLQFRTMPNGDQFFGVYVSPKLRHDYLVPPNTNLTRELKVFADRVEAQQEARATVQPPEGKHH